MSILDGLRKDRGRQTSTSAAVSRLHLKRRPSNGLSADRLAAALGTLPVVPPGGESSRSPVWVPKRTRGARTPLDDRAHRRAIRRAASVVQHPVVSVPVGSRVAPPGTGRHRGTDEQMAGWVQQSESGAGPLRHEGAPGSTIGENVPAGSARRRRMPVVEVRRSTVRAVPATLAPATVDPAGGRHRRATPSKRAILTRPAALLGVHAHVRLLVAVGVLALLVAVAMMFGVRVAVSRPSAQPQLVATTAATTAHGQVGAREGVWSGSRQG